MTLAYYIKKESLFSDSKVISLLKSLEEKGLDLYKVSSEMDILPETEFLLSLGGDGTFLSASEIAIKADIPILGVNFGRLGFLSGASAEELPDIISNDELQIEERELLEIKTNEPSLQNIYPYALNEISVSRVGASMLGVDVEIDGVKLPTYWADGLLVATSSGSTAYSLSVGGPICSPESKVFLLCPISPHNLNLRPLVIPQSSFLRLALRSRSDAFNLSLDNRNFTLGIGSSLEIRVAELKLKRMKVRSESFFNALRSRLYWGEDLRNR